MKIGKRNTFAIERDSSYCWGAMIGKLTMSVGMLLVNPTQ